MIRNAAGIKASTSLISSFNKHNFHLICDQLGKTDPHLQAIMQQYGYPPMWRRTNNFASLIHIILEQQVSLASAKAAFVKLKSKLGTITPAKLLLLSDEELKACYFSRQKTKYARHLAEMMMDGRIHLNKMKNLENDVIREQLKMVKGIGDWTVDIYLLFVLQRADVFPHGDLAMMNALKEIKNLQRETGKDKIIKIAEQWKPYRSVATMLFWHHYIQKRGIKL